MVEKAITHQKGENKINAINETDKPQASQSKKDKSINNESNKGMELDISRSLNKPGSSQRTETEEIKKNQGLFHHPVYLIKIPK